MGQGFDLSFQRELATQSWTLYGIGMFVILLRTFARYRRVRSISLLAPDDWLMITLVPLFYTTLIVCLNVIAEGGGSNLYPPEEFSSFTEQEIRERIKGSKIVVVSEQAMLNVIWALKASMLFLFARLSASTTHLKYIRYLSIYVALGWLAVEISFFTACRPFKGYWGMPPPDPQCTTFQHYAMVQAVFNLSSDVAMLAIPVPMLWGLKLPWRQKVGLGVVFSMGVFVIIAATLTKIYNLSDIYSTVYMLWYVREASVAVYVANLPSIWPLLREHFRFLRSHLSSYQNGSNRTTALPQHARSRQTRLESSSVHRSSNRKSKVAATATVMELRDNEIELGKPSFDKSMASSRKRSNPKPGDEIFGREFRRLGLGTGRRSLDSDEKVLNEGNAGWAKNGGPNLAVHIDQTIEVTRGSWDGREEGKELERFKWEVETTAPKVTIQGP